MVRYSHTFRAFCLCSVAAGVLVGCSSNMKAADERNRMAAMQHYDQYYGMPPRHAVSPHNKKHQSRNVPNAANKQHAAVPSNKLSKQAIKQKTKRHGMVVNPSAPRTYTVKKGDTLWSIAKKFLLTPSYWPEIWHRNQRIANPHLIYPGDVLHFGYVPEKSSVSHAPRENVMKMVPRIRVERKGYGQPLATLAPFLAWPRVLDDAAIKNAPYVLASRDDHTLIAQGDRVYIKNLQQAHPGSRHAIFHPRKPLYNPENGKLLGHQVDYVAHARIDVADKLSSATILKAKDAVRRGDRLLPEDKQAQALRAPIQLPRHKVRGQIMSLYKAKYLSADCMIIVINRGKKQGIKQGYTLGVYSDGLTVRDVNRRATGDWLHKYPAKTQLPPEKVAEAIVYSVSDELSYAIIINSSREVKNGDKIGNP